MKIKVLPMLLFIPLFLAIYSLQVQVDQISAKMPKAESLSLLPKGDLLKSISLGYSAVIADLLWLEVVQAIGDKQANESGYQWIYNAIDVVTSLDPKFEYAYQIGGIALSSLGKQYELSNKILLKGSRNLPEEWKLPFYLGFNYYFYLNDYQNAAKYISLSATLPGHSAYLPGFAARLYVEANDPDLALEFLNQIHDDSKDERTKEQIGIRIKEVIVERDIRELNKAIDVYQEKVGEIGALSDLVRSKIIQRVPPEPFGGFYLLDPVLKLSQSSTHPNRMKVFRK